MNRADDIRKIVNEAIIIRRYSDICCMDELQLDVAWRMAMLLGLNRLFAHLLDRSYDELVELSHKPDDELIAAVLAIEIEHLGD
jgi:hypothetical protein